MDITSRRAVKLLQKLSIKFVKSEHHVSGWIDYQGKQYLPIHFSLSRMPMNPNIAKKLLDLLKLKEEELKALATCYIGKNEFKELFINRYKTGESLELLETPTLFDSAGKPIHSGEEIPSNIIKSINDLKDDLLIKIYNNPEILYNITPREFEIFVYQLLAKKGFDAKLTPATKDSGKDIYVSLKNELGNSTIYIECKRYSKHRRVGVEIVRKLYGTIEADRVTAGLLATTSSFTRNAQEFQRTVKHRLWLADFFKLIEWIEASISVN